MIHFTEISMTDYLGYFLKPNTPHIYVCDLHAHFEFKMQLILEITFERNPIKANISCIFTMIGGL